MEDKRHPAHDSTERSGQFSDSEESRSLDSFMVAAPRVSAPAAPMAAAADDVDPYDFDD
jgi:hypothetical protein